jgi:methyl-accepting chemotaxis protein
MFFANLKIGQRLGVGFGLMLLFIGALGGIAVWNAMRFSSQITELSENNTKGAVQLANAQNALWQLRYGFPQFMVAPDAQVRAKIVADEAKWYKVGEFAAQRGRGRRKKNRFRRRCSKSTSNTSRHVRAGSNCAAGKFRRPQNGVLRPRLPSGRPSALTNLIQQQQKAADDAEERARRMSALRNLLTGLVGAVTLGVFLAGE